MADRARTRLSPDRLALLNNPADLRLHPSVAGWIANACACVTNRRNISGPLLWRSRLGAAFTARSVRDWYPKLRKPAGIPPDSYFGPVWTALYILMAVAAWNVYLKGGGLHQA